MRGGHFGSAGVIWATMDLHTEKQSLAVSGGCETGLTGGEVHLGGQPAPVRVRERGSRTTCEYLDGGQTQSSGEDGRRKGNRGEELFTLMPAGYKLLLCDWVNAWMWKKLHPSALTSTSTLQSVLSYQSWVRWRRRTRLVLHLLSFSHLLVATWYPLVSVPLLLSSFSKWNSNFIRRWTYRGGQNIFEWGDSILLFGLRCRKIHLSPSKIIWLLVPPVNEVGF